MKRMNKTKTILVLAMAALILAAAVGGTVAYLLDISDPVVNTFEPAKVSCAVNETFTNNEKTDVSIQNTSNVRAYIRAAIVGNWYKDGEIVAPWKVTDGNFEELLDSAKWSAADGFYYYSEPVAPNTATEKLFTKFTAPATKPVEGSHLELTILCQAIQADGMGVDNAVAAWAKAKQ